MRAPWHPGGLWEAHKEGALLSWGTSCGHRGCALHNSRSYPFTVCTGSPLLTPWEREHGDPRPASSSSAQGQSSWWQPGPQCRGRGPSICAVKPPPSEGSLLPVFIPLCFTELAKKMLFRNVSLSCLDSEKRLNKWSQSTIRPRKLRTPGG